MTQLRKTDSVRRLAAILPLITVALSGCFAATHARRPPARTGQSAIAVAKEFVRRMTAGDVPGARRLAATNAPSLDRNITFLADEARHAVAYGERLLDGAVKISGTRILVPIRGKRTRHRSDRWWACTSESGDFIVEVVADQPGLRVRSIYPANWDSKGSVARNRTLLSC